MQERVSSLRGETLGEEVNLKKRIKQISMSKSVHVGGKQKQVAEDGFTPAVWFSFFYFSMSPPRLHYKISVKQLYFTVDEHLLCLI